MPAQTLARHNRRDEENFVDTLEGMFQRLRSIVVRHAELHTHRGDTFCIRGIADTGNNLSTG